MDEIATHNKNKSLLQFITVEEIKNELVPSW
jgi:hypothetical protein